MNTDGRREEDLIAQVRRLEERLAEAQALGERLKRENGALARQLAAQQTLGARRGEPSAAVNEPPSALPCAPAIVRDCERAQSLHAVFQGAAFGIALVDRRGRLQEVNPTLRRMLGSTAAALPAQTLADLLHPEEVDDSRDRFHEVLEGRRPSCQMEGRLARRDRGTLWVRLTLSRVIHADDSPTCAVAMLEDVTARKSAEHSLRDAKERLQAVFEATPLPVMALDLDTRVTAWNRAAERVFGWRAEEVLGQPYPAVPPESRVHFEEAWQRLLRGEVLTGWETRRVRKDGTRVDISLSTAPLYDAQGRITGTMGVMEEITQRKRQEVEREQLLAREQAALAEAQDAYRARERFLAIVSHELRTPLAPILTGVHLLQAEPRQSKRAQRTLEIMERNVNLQARLVDHLLNVARDAQVRKNLSRRPLDLTPVVAAVVEAQRETARQRGIEITTAVAPDVWVEGDPDPLLQAVGELFANTLRLATRGDTVAVSLTQEESAARLTICNTSTRIDRSALPRVFEAFEQSADGGLHAVGLDAGFALVRALIQGHGGRVWAESAGAEHGSRFVVELPRIARPEATEAEARSEAVHVRLLLVEDHADTRALLATTLEMLGYEVNEAASGEDALRLLQRVRPDLIVSDVGLPGMDGCEFLRRAREISGMHEVPAVAVTGWGQEEDVCRTRNAGYRAHLTKPVDITTLDRLLRELLPSRS